MPRTLDPSAAWDAPANRDAAAAVGFLPCPAVRRERGPIPPGQTTYLGVAGVGPDAAARPPTDPRAGVFGFDRTTTIADITDGTSTTLFALDSGHDLGPWAKGG